MGICASCLGLNRHPSQDTRETDALLHDDQGQYGAVGAGDATQPDEEELRREREALEHITSEATDNMIDVLQPGTSDVSQHLAHAGGQRADSKMEARTADEDEESEENAWLQSVQASGADDLATVKGLQSGHLVMDITQLRDGPAPSSSKRYLKAKVNLEYKRAVDGRIPTINGKKLNELIKDLTALSIVPDDIDATTFTEPVQVDLEKLSRNITTVSAWVHGELYKRHYSSPKWQLSFQWKKIFAVPGAIFSMPVFEQLRDDQIAINDPNRINSRCGPGIAKDRPGIIIESRGGEIITYASGTAFGDKGRPPEFKKDQYLMQYEVVYSSPRLEGSDSLNLWKQTSVQKILISYFLHAQCLPPSVTLKDVGVKLEVFVCSFTGKGDGGWPR